MQQRQDEEAAERDRLAQLERERQQRLEAIQQSEHVLLWTRFANEHEHFMSASADADAHSDSLELLRDAVLAVGAFAAHSARLCGQGLLHCRSQATCKVKGQLFAAWLSLLELKHDAIRECVVQTAQRLLDVAKADEDDDDGSDNDGDIEALRQLLASVEVISLLSRALMVRHSDEDADNAAFSLCASARVDMRILQIMAVHGGGREVLHHRVFERIKECVMAPRQSDDFVVYALGVIRTILEDEGPKQSLALIGRDAEANTDALAHTIQFAVYTLETHAHSDAQQLARAILVVLDVDVRQALREYGSGDHSEEHSRSEDDNDDEVMDGQPTMAAEMRGRNHRSKHSSSVRPSGTSKKTRATAKTKKKRKMTIKARSSNGCTTSNSRL